MNDTTDTAAVAEGPITEEAAVDWLLSPESTETEEETDEAPAEPTEAEEPDAEEDAPDEAENTEEDSEDADPDEDDDPDTDEDEEEPGDRYIVKVDGEEREVTLDELKRGYSGQAYIQQGMEQAKQFQKQLQEQAQAVQQERQVLMQMYQQATATGFQPAPQPPSRELLSQDPIAYMEAEAEYRDNLQAYQQQQQQMEYLQQREAENYRAQEQQFLQSQAQLMQELIPEFRDAKKAPELRDKLVKTAEGDYGYSREEVMSIKDARAIRVLRDAVAYRELQAGKQAAKQPRERATAVTKPQGKATAGKRQQAQKQFQKAMKTQSDDDWVNVLLDP